MFKNIRRGDRLPLVHGDKNRGGDLGGEKKGKTASWGTI